MPILDIHAHVYPEAIALKAAASIGDFYEIPMRHDGTLKTLLGEEQKAGITHTVICSVAVTWEKAARINDFIAASIAENENLTGFATLHPDHPHVAAEIDRAVSLGLKGLKLHPDFQHFHIDDPHAFPMYEAIEGRLPLLIHTGDTRYEFSRPERMARVLDRFPRMQAICAHLGGWSRWTDAYKVLAGRPNVWVDTSSSLYAISREEARAVILQYGVDRVLFGTDYPMWTPLEELGRLEALGFSPEDMEKMLFTNAVKLLNLA
jgi:uncharacterized protein